MRIYQREKYKLTAYHEERYMLEIYDPVTRTESSEYHNHWEYLYEKAKKEVQKGKECHIWELKYEFTY